MNPNDTNLRDHFEIIKQAKADKAKADLVGMFGGYDDKPAPMVTKTFDSLPDFKPANVQTFFDITIGEEGKEGYESGRVVFEIFSEDVPKTAENFRQLCVGDRGHPLHYKHNVFHRIISGFMMQGGDTTAGNGTGGVSIYGEKFDDEQIWFPHTHAGLLSMANAGPNTNGSQFFVCYKDTPHLDGKHTVYGRAISGFEICQKAENIEKDSSDKPLLNVCIADCGELTGDDKLSAENADFLATYAA